MVVVCVLQEEVETARRVNKTRHSVREKEGKERLAGQHHKECKPCALQSPPSLHLALALTHTPPSPCTPNTLSATSHQLPCCCPPLTIQASPQPSTHSAALFCTSAHTQHKQATRTPRKRRGGARALLLAVWRRWRLHACCAVCLCLEDAEGLGGLRGGALLHLEDVEAHSLGQRAALADGDDVTLLHAEARRAVC